MASRPKRDRAAKLSAAIAKEKEESSDSVDKQPKKARGQTRGGRVAKKATGESHHAGGTEHGTMLERGLIYFFYRPKVEKTEVKGPDDVQRLYVVLSPGADVRHDTESSSHKKRVIIIGSKHLPEMRESGRRAMTWGFVDTVSHDIKDIHKALDPASYATETKGERHLAGCRPCGEGVYAIYDYPRHTHLAYVLELPQHPGEVQNFFHIEQEGSYVINAKNPDNLAANPHTGLTPTERAKLPKELEKTFGGRKWSKVNPVQLLDYAGIELLLIGASANVREDLGDEGNELEITEQLDAKAITESKLFQELKMHHKNHPAQALFGQWA